MTLQVRGQHGFPRPDSLNSIRQSNFSAANCSFIDGTWHFASSFRAAKFRVKLNDLSLVQPVITTRTNYYLGALLVVATTSMGCARTRDDVEVLNRWLVPRSLAGSDKVRFQYYGVNTP